MKIKQGFYASTHIRPALLMLELLVEFALLLVIFHTFENRVILLPINVF